MSTERYTHMQHNIRKHFGLTMEEYAVLDAIYCLSRNQACDAKSEYFIELFDLKRRTYFDIKKSLSDKKLIEKVKGGVKTSKIWDDAMAGRVAPWVDPSIEHAPVEEPAQPEPEKNPENSKSAEIALCEKCLKAVQNLHSKEIKSAEIAPLLCKNCTLTVRNLHSDSAKIALHNTDINIVINTEINNTPVPVGPDAFEAIKDLFVQGSEKKTGQAYYHNAKEASHIKMLSKRYLNNPDKFINHTRLFYWLTTKSGNEFWMKKPFTPSVFNSLYEHIVNYKPSDDQVKRDQLKNKTDDELMIEKYGKCNLDELKYLHRNNVIGKDDFDMLSHRLLGVAS